MKTASPILVAIDMSRGQGGLLGETAEPGARRGHARRATRSTDDLVLATAIRLARALDASLDVVHVRQKYMPRVLGVLSEALGEAEEKRIDAWIDRRLAQVSRRAAANGISCYTTTLTGSPRRQIARHIKATQPQLVVVGTRNGRLFHHGIASYVTRRGGPPVLTVPV